MALCVLLQQMVRMAEGNNGPATQDFHISTYLLRKPYRASYDFFFFFKCLRQSQSIMFPAFWRQNLNEFYLPGAKISFHLKDRKQLIYLFFFFSANLQTRTGILAGPGLTQIWTELGLFDLMYPNKGTLNSVRIWFM